MNNKPLLDRYMARTRKEGDCLVWIGDKYDTGYGRITLYPSKKCRRAHRVIYEIVKGPITQYQYVNHSCGRRDCINPDHLVSRLKRDSILLSNSTSGINSRKTHCVRGHPFSGTNVRLKKKVTSESGIVYIRICRACNLIHQHNHNKKYK